MTSEQNNPKVSVDVDDPYFQSAVNAGARKHDADGSLAQILGERPEKNGTPPILPMNITDKQARSMDACDYQIIRQLFDDYLRMYLSRDDRLTAYFSEDFSGFTGGGDFLVKDREAWVAITRQDFAQIKDPIRVDIKDLSIQSLAATVAVVTSFFTIHLPIKDHVLSRETARLVLIFRKESAGWKISHSSISIPYYLVREGEIYPMKELMDRNQYLEKLVAERTMQLSEANDNLHRTNEKWLILRVYTWTHVNLVV